MTREEIIAMAREAGFEPLGRDSWDCFTATIERFAALVAAKEREACARVCDTAYYQFIGPELGEVRHGIAACSTAIRARGQP